MMMYNRALGATILSASWLTGCAVGPDFLRPAAPAVSAYTRDPLAPQTASSPAAHGAAQRFVPDMDIPAEWWQVFRSEPLNKLIRDSLAANPNLTAAQAALRQAHENTLAQRGAYFPTVEGELNASRNLTPVEALSPAGPTGNPYYSLITPQLNVSFVPDVWGANRRAVESLAAQEQSQRFQLEATYLTLTSNVVSGAVQEASLRGQIAATGETIKIETALLAILRRQLNLGQVAGADIGAGGRPGSGATAAAAAAEAVGAATRRADRAGGALFEPRGRGDV